MPVENFNCKLPPTPIPVNNKFEPSEMSDVQRRVWRLTERLMATKNAVPEELQEAANVHAAVAARRWENAMTTASSQVLEPGKGDVIGHFLAKNFAVWRDKMGFGKGTTVSGDVRQTIIRAERKYKGAVADKFAELEVEQFIASKQKELQDIRKAHGIPRREWRKLMMDSVEIGWHPYLEDALNTGNESQLVLAGDQRRLLRNLEEAGLSKGEIETVLEAAKSVSDRFMEVTKVVSMVGVDTVSDDELIGMFPRIFTDETLKRLTWQKAGDGIIFNDGKKMRLDDAFISSRNVNHFVVEDAVLLDAVLDLNTPGIYGKLGVDDVYGLMDDSKKLGTALLNELGEEALDKLVDSGIVSKIPMRTTELYEAMVKRYRLPFSGLDELLIDDWTGAVRHYKEQLTSLAGDAGKNWAIVHNAIEGNWGVPKRVVDADPDKYKKFIPLSEVIPGNVQKQMGLSDASLMGIGGGTTENTYSILSDTFVHPIAADMYKSMLLHASEPGAMASFGRAVENFNSMFKATVLATAGTVYRALWGNTIMVSAAGGNVAEFYGTLPKMMISSARNTLDVFDNKFKTFHGLNGEPVTERELYHQLVKTSFINDLTPMTGETVTQGVKAKGYTLKAPKYIVDAYMNYGFLAGLEDTGTLFKHLANDVPGHPFRVANVIADNAAKFGLIKSLTRIDDGSIGSAINNVAKLGSSLQMRGFKRLDEAIEHAAEYFFWYDDRGAIDNVIGKFVQPFWMFTSRNPVAQVRHAIRNPRVYTNYHRLWAINNRQMAAEGEDAPDGGVPDWVKESNPLYWVIPEEDSASGKREYFVIPLVGVDPVSDGWNTVGFFGDVATKSFGTFWGKPKTTQERIDEAKVWEKKPIGVADPFTTLFSKTYPIFKAGFNTFAGSYPDPFDPSVRKPFVTDPSGRDNTSFLGVKVHPFMRMWMETLLPGASILNRENPGDIFGRKEQRDGMGNIIVPALPSSLPGGAERSDSDAKKINYQLAGKYPFMRFLMDTGINVSAIDVAKNMGYKESDIRFSLNEGKDAIVSMRRVAEREQDPKKKEQYLETVEKYKAGYYRLLEEYKRIEAWRLQRGIPSPAAKRALNNGEIKSQDLPQLSPDVQKKLLEQVSKM